MEQAADNSTRTATPTSRRSRSPLGDHATDSPKSKKERIFRTPQACDRCHRRKQRCDGNAHCRPCQQAGVECTTTDKTSQRTITRSLLPDLEERIVWLEDLIKRSHPKIDIHAMATGSTLVLGPIQSPSSNTYITDPVVHAPYTSQPSGSTVDLNRLVFPEELEPNGNLFLDPSLESGDMYIPPKASSTYGLYARHMNPAPREVEGTSATKIFAASLRTTSQLPSSITSKPKYPEFSIAKGYIDAYFHHNHTYAPFLHHPSFQSLVIRFYSHEFLDQEPHWLFILNMVLAIGQTTLIRQEALRGITHQNDPSFQFFDTAMNLLEISISSTSITTVQCLLLLCTYGLQHPQAVSIYRIVAQAMRVCIELSLHRTQNRKLSLTPLDREMRKRIFWSAYSLDRFASISLGRPCSIADECISCEFPLDIADSSIQQNNLVTVPPGSASEMTFSLSIFKLRRITGRIIQLLYCSTQSNDNQSTLVDRFVMELEAWRLTIPASDRAASDQSIVPSVFKSNNYFNLGYWHARLLLYRLLAPRGVPHDLRNCAEAAIQSVRLYSLLLDEKRININWSTLALCFTAGVTLLWCVWLAPEQNLAPSISMGDVQDGMQCTERVLGALGDIWPTARKCQELYQNLCATVVVTQQDGAVQGISTNIMDHLESAPTAGNPDSHYAGIADGFLIPNAELDSFEQFEQLGWTLGGFNA